MEQAVRKPDIEITRKLKNGYTRSYGHLYWKPFLLAIFLFGWIDVFRDKKLRVLKPKKK